MPFQYTDQIRLYDTHKYTILSPSSFVVKTRPENQTLRSYIKDQLLMDKFLGKPSRADIMEHPQSNLKTESSGTEGFAQTAIKFWESRNFSKRAEEPALPTSKATKSTPEDRMAEQSTSGTEPGTQTSSDSQDRLESASVPVGKAIERAHGLRQLSIVSEDSEHSLPTASDLGDKSRKNSDSGGVTLNYAQEVTQMQSATVESEVEVQSRRGSIQTIAESTAFKLDPFASWQPPQREESPGSVQGGVPIDPGVGDGVQNYVAQVRIAKHDITHIYTIQNSVSGLNTPVRQPSSDLRGHSRNVDPAGSEDEAAGVRTTSQHALQESDRRLVYDHPMMWQTDPQRTSPSTVSPGRMSGGQPSNSQGVSPLKNVVSSSLVGDNDDGDGEGFSNVLNEGGGAAAPPVQAGIPSTQGMSYTRIPTVSNSVSRRVLGDLFPTSQVAGNLGKRMPHSSGLTIAQGQEQQGVPQAAAIPGFSYQQQTQGNRSAGQETFNTPQWGGSAFGLRPDVELKRRIGILDQYGYKSLSELRAAFSTGANRAKGNTFVGTPTHQPALNFTSHHNTLHHHYPNTSLAYQNPYTFNTPSPYYTREVTSQTAGGKAKMAGRDTEQESLVEDFQNLGRAGRQTQSPTRMGPPSRRGQPYRPQTPENRQSSVDFPFPDDEHPFLQSSPQAQIARNKAAGLDLFGRPLNHSQQNQAQNQAQHQSQSHTRLSALREIGQSAEQRAAIAQGYSQLHYQRDDSHNTQRRHLTINTSMQNNQRDDNEAEGSSSQYLDYGLTHGPGGNIEIQPRHPIVLTPSRTGHQSHIQGVSSPYGYSQYGQQQGTHQTPQLHQTHSGGAFHPTPSNFAQPSGPGRPQRHRTSQLNAQAASFSSTRTPQAQLGQPQLGQATSGSQQSGYPQFEQSPSVFTPSNQAVYASPVLPGPSVFNTHVPGLPPSAFGGFHPYVPHPAWPEPDTLTTWDPDSLQQTGGASVLEALGSVQDIAPNALYSRAPVPGERSHFRPVLSIIPRGLSNHPDLADPSTIGNDGPSTMIPRRRAVNTTALNATAVTTVAPTYSVVVFADLRNVAGGHAPQRPYHPGTDRMFPIPSVQGTSVRLQQLIRNGRPSFEKVILPYFFPFFEVARNAEPHKWGVIKITNVSTVRSYSHISISSNTVSSHVFDFMLSVSSISRILKCLHCAQSWPLGLLFKRIPRYSRI